MPSRETEKSLDVNVLAPTTELLVEALEQIIKEIRAGYLETDRFVEATDVAYSFSISEASTPALN